MEAALRTRIPQIMLETAEVTFCVRGVRSPLLSNIVRSFVYEVIAPIRSQTGRPTASIRRLNTFVTCD